MSCTSSPVGVMCLFTLSRALSAVGIMCFRSITFPHRYFLSAMSAYTFYWPPSILTHSSTFLVDETLELYVHSPVFDKECALYSKGVAKGSPSGGTSDSGYSSDHTSLWENDSSSSSVPSVESSRYGVSKLEAYLYFFWNSGSQTLGAQIDHPDVQGHLHSAFGARARSSSYAVEASVQAPKTRQRQSLGYYSF